MRDLFAIRSNEGGWFVYPVTQPPASEQPMGNEVGVWEAFRLCRSLNQAVEKYIAQMAEDEPKTLLRILAKHRSWKAIVSLIGELLWREAWDRKEESYSAFRRYNSQALGRIVRDWK